MEISLKLISFEYSSHSDQTSTAILLIQFKELTVFFFGDNDPILKVISQLTKVDFIAKFIYFLTNG